MGVESSHVTPRLRKYVLEPLCVGVIRGRRDWRSAISSVLQKAVLHTDRVSLHVSPSSLMRWLFDDESAVAGLVFPETWKLEVPCQLTRRGKQLHIVVKTFIPLRTPHAGEVDLGERRGRGRERHPQ